MRDDYTYGFIRPEISDSPRSGHSKLEWRAMTRTREEEYSPNPMREIRENLRRGTRYNTCTRARGAYIYIICYRLSA